MAIMAGGLRGGDSGCRQCEGDSKGGEGFEGLHGLLLCQVSVLAATDNQGLPLCVAGN